MTIHSSPWPQVILPQSSVYDLLWSNPNNLPDSSIAIIDGPSGRKYTRGDLKRDSEEIAYGLVHQLNLAPQSVVCIFSPNSFYYHLLVSSLQCAGLIISGANAAYTPTELIHQLKDSATQHLFVHPSVLEVALASTAALGWTKARQVQSIVLAVLSSEAGEAGKTFKSIDQIQARGQRLSPVVIREPKTTIAYLGYSSGTSGAAKGVRTSHWNMTSVLSILYPLDITQHDIHIAVLPLNHIYGATKLTLWPIVIGTPVVVVPRFDLKDFCTLVERYKVTVAMLVPPIALLLAREKIVDDFDMSSLNLVISGAAPLGAELEKQLAKRLGTNVAQAYGLTETSPTTHYCPIATPRAGSIGPLLPMMRSRICDPLTGLDVPDGTQGELLLQGPNVMMGYLNRPAADAETLFEDKDGIWLKTGDIGYVDSEGFHYITDRLKELIKVKGFQFAPSEAEATLLDCPLVSDVAVVGVYDENEATEWPRAYVVLSAEGKKTKDAPAEIAKWFASRVAAYKRLKGGVVIQDIIPKSPSGKLLRRILRDQAKVEFAAALKAKL